VEESTLGEDVGSRVLRTCSAFALCVLNRDLNGTLNRVFKPLLKSIESFSLPPSLPLPPPLAHPSPPSRHGDHQLLMDRKGEPPSSMGN